MYQELGAKFEEKQLKFAANFAVTEVEEIPDYVYSSSQPLDVFLPGGQIIHQNYYSSTAYSVLVGMAEEEIAAWKGAYASDMLFSRAIEALTTDLEESSKYTQYQIRSNRLVYLEDWNGNFRLCVPKSMRLQVMDETHNVLTESAHGGYAKTYNHIAATYYWPQMSRHVKRYVSTCDICQKLKPCCHAPIGLLQPIPIPSHPFEVVSMDFIPELPNSDGFDNILVIVDKLTKYAIFIPTNTSITEKGTTNIFFYHVITKFGIL
jgi:hypothetical protein